MKIKALFMMMIFFLPGCINNPDSSEDLSGVYNYVTFNIYYGESLEEAEATFEIKIKLNHTAAPNHADNLYKHVEAGNYNITQFHRIIDDFMIQGGDFENYDGTGGYAADWYGICNGYIATVEDCPDQTNWNVPDEADNGLKHLSCTMSMAKTAQANSAGSQFFLIPDDIEHHEFLDGDYTVFGEIVSGCEHVTTISEVATADGDRPVVPVVLYGAFVSEN